ncbi:hypothetical protein ACLBYD_12070 [Rhodococcus sp. C26F]
MAPLTKGGPDTVTTSMVGTCQRADCVHNRDLECTAGEIHVGAGTEDHAARCLTYSRR